MNLQEFQPKLQIAQPGSQILTKESKAKFSLNQCEARPGEFAAEMRVYLDKNVQSDSEVPKL